MSSAVLEKFTGYCHDRKCKGDLQPDGTVLTLRLLTPDGFKLLVTRDEAVAICTLNDWMLTES